MATITINSNDYDSLCSEADADIVLAADMARHAAWTALSADNKKIALVSSTRLLLRADWIGDAPDPTGTVAEVVRDACAMSAADIAADNELSKASNVKGAGDSAEIKSVGAGAARVEFFGRSTTDKNAQSILSGDVHMLLFQAGLLGDDSAMDAGCYVGGDQKTRFNDGVI